MSTGAVVWITGRPSSGKSTLAKQLQAKLSAKGLPAVIFDSDEVREALRTHDYSEEGRRSFYATLGSLAALVTRQGIIAVVPATAHRQEYREHARRVSPRFLEVYVSTPVEECARRDPKGLYVQARTAGIELPGMTVAYEPPSSPDVVAQGGHDSSAIDAVVRLLASERSQLS